MKMIDELAENNTKKELLEMAEEEGADANTGMTKAEIAKAIVENQLGGAIDEDAEVTEDVEEEELDPFSEDSEVVRFTGRNASFNFGGKVFTKKSPFAVMTVQEADHAVRTWPNKFRPATKTEVADWYGV